MNFFPDVSKQSLKPQTISESFYKKKNLLGVSNLFRNFMPDKL